MATEEQQLRATAYHESGHAVASELLGHPASVVTIRPSDFAGGKVEGGLELRRSDIGGLQTAKIDDALVITCAGPIAEARFLGEDPLEFLARPPDGTDLGPNARLLLGIDSDWQLVTRVAEEVSRAYGVPLSSVVSHALEQAVEAQKLIDAHWPAVEAVATALLERETLSRSEVQAAMSSTERV